MLTADQCRAARALLNWTQADLAERVSVSAVSIRAFEKGGEMRDSNQKLIRLTLEAAGVVFIPENGGGAGVRLAKPKGGEKL
jgi:transcriptional regulator with XRE-family HTH domain